MNKEKMMRIIKVVSLTLPVLFFSCKKESGSISKSELTPAPVTYPSYSRLKPGNYWIYQRFHIDGDSIATPLNEFDSTYVEKDTLIGNSIYYKVRAYDFLYKTPSIGLLRDSLHYIVAVHSGISFSSEDFTTIFDTFYSVSNGDTVYSYLTKMEDKDNLCVVPAGSFTTSNMRSTVLIYPNWAVQGIPNPRYRHVRRAKNVGMITATEPFYLGSPDYWEIRLIRYHVE
jgi:hypothetical protein